MIIINMDQWPILTAFCRISLSIIKKLNFAVGHFWSAIYISLHSILLLRPFFVCFLWYNRSKTGKRSRAIIWSIITTTLENKFKKWNKSFNWSDPEFKPYKKRELQIEKYKLDVGKWCWWDNSNRDRKS